MKVSTVKAKCSYCRGTLIKAGTYYRKKRPHWRQRYRCLNCKKTMLLDSKRNLLGIKRWDNRVRNEVLKLVNKRYININNKFDNRKSPYLSSRKIVELIYKKYSQKLSKSTIALMINKYRKIENGTAH